MFEIMLETPCHVSWGTAQGDRFCRGGVKRPSGGDDPAAKETANNAKAVGFGR